MKTEVVLVTPEMAAEWLEKNSSNRPMRKHVIEHYARQMRDGVWVLTHQGVCVDRLGNLIDGQHRLSAIVLAGVAVLVMVTTTDHEESAMGAPVDLGLGRTYSDILGLPRKHVEIVRLIQEIANHGGRSRRLSTAEVGAIYRHTQGQIEALPAPILSASCAHRLATILAAIIAPAEAGAIREQASWFATGSNCTQWWSSVEAFNRYVKQSPNSRWHGSEGRMEYVIRWRAAMLSPQLKISRITNDTLAAREVREQAREIVTASGVTL